GGGEADRRGMGGRPVESREDPGKRPGETFDRVRYDRESGIGEARGIAIGVEDDRRALRLEPREDALENGLAADAQARLVAAAHAARQAAGEHEAENRRDHSPPPAEPPRRASGAHAT